MFHPATTHFSFQLCKSHVKIFHLNCKCRAVCTVFDERKIENDCTILTDFTTDKYLLN